MCSHRHVILHLQAKFRSNRSTNGGVMTLHQMVISIFQDGGHRVEKLLSVAGLVMEHVEEGQNLFAYQISTRYLNPRVS